MVVKIDVWYKLVIPCFAFPFISEVARGRSEVQGRRKWPLCFRDATSGIGLSIRMYVTRGETDAGGISRCEIPNRGLGINPLRSYPRFHIFVCLGFASSSPIIILKLPVRIKCSALALMIFHRLRLFPHLHFFSKLKSKISRQD